MNVSTSTPVRPRPSGKKDVRTQFGAICWRRRKKKVEVLLITSRRTRRWLVPKGWPMDGKTPPEAAAREAYEEAGVAGLTDERCLGIYLYEKQMETGDDLQCAVALYPLRVQTEFSAWPERDERIRRWLGPKKAAKLVVEPDLSRILRDFEPPA